MLFEQLYKTQLMHRQYYVDMLYISSWCINIVALTYGYDVFNLHNYNIQIPKSNYETKIVTQ